MAHNISIIETHPQRQRIIDAILAGKTLREISAFCDPPVSHAAIHRYRHKRVTPALRNASALAKVLRDEGLQNTPSPETNQVLAVTRETLVSDPIIQRMEQHRSKRLRWLANAESKEDYRALAALDRNELADVELHARLTGRLDAPQMQGGSTTIVLMPFSLPAAPQEQGKVIDVEPISEP